ncbi:MAG TPA: PIG-L family deacetylase [Gemmatimonadaceae bacterium]|nr:PIG-L family deacetylase [Gemmatimonadaceae bacterium]
MTTRFLCGTLLLASTVAAGAQNPPAAPAPPRTVLAIGAHAGDMELTTGLALLGARDRGDRVVLLHLTLGERGNPKLSPDEYAAQKRREAEAAARALGGEARFGPWKDGELPNDEAARRWVADVIRDVKPSVVLTHWRESIHKDHATTHAVVKDAVLLASLQGIESPHPPHRGVRAVWYAENWEDADGFRPYVYVDVTAAMDRWREAVRQYEFVRGSISTFAYLDYYTALAGVRGAESRKGRAIAFEVDPSGKRRILDVLP